MTTSTLPRWAQRSALVLALALGVAACGSKTPKPADLGPNIPLLPVRQAWHSSIPSLKNASIAPQVVGQSLVLAAADGTVVSLDGATGREQWRGQVGKALLTGVGSDGTQAAVVTVANELVLLNQGRTQWSKPLNAAAYTAPLVAGGRVFVLTADRHLSAYDAQDGAHLWTLQRDGEPLVLRQQGVLVAHGNTLLAGLSGRLVAIDPDNGAVLWEAPLAAPRGTNDVERLVEIVGHTSRVGDNLCARAFQATVGCIDAARGAVLWTQPAGGSEGLDGDAEMLFGTESNGTVFAWQRADGKRAWTSERLQFRKLTAPLLLGRSVVIGDDAGLVHLLSRADAAPLNRLATDGSGIAAAPVAAGDTLVVVTRKGGVYGFRPD